MRWRRLVHDAIVEALSSSPTFQSFAARTSGRVQELGGKGARILQDLQQPSPQAAPRVHPDLQERTSPTFLSVFVSELKVGLDKMLWRRRGGGGAERR